VYCGMLLVTCLWAVHAQAVEKTYLFGVVPQFRAVRITQVWKPILAQIGKQTGLQLELSGSASISAFEKEFLRGKFDFAYMNPYHFLKAHNTQGYIPLVRDTGRKLFGIIVVHKDSPFTRPSQLDGKTVIFPHPMPWAHPC